MKTDRIIALSVIALCFISVLSSLFFQKQSHPVKTKSKGINLMTWYDSGFGIKEGDIAVIEINGMITYGSSGGFASGGADANLINDTLEQVKKDKLKGILLRINSPGGTASASQAIYEKIMSIKKSDNIKVYSIMQDVAASGAYYIASASDVIYANPSTLTGSIGVIMELPDYTELGNKIGFHTNVIKSGKFKDIGNGSRKITSDEKDLLQKLIDDTYGEFAKAVARGRNLPLDYVKSKADGRIYTGNQALQIKLIDKLGQESDAIAALGKELRISGEPKLKSYSKPSWERVFENLGAKSSILGVVLQPQEFSLKFGKIPLMLYR